MRRRSRKALVGGVAALASVLGFAAHAWACVPVSTITVTPDRARPGETVTVSGIRFLGPNPVSVHLHAFDGPVVATLEMPRSANTLFKTDITVPADAPPGPLVVVATQEAFAEGAFAGWGVPTRAVVTVLDSDGNAPPSTVPAVPGRPADLAKESIDAATVVLVALGVAAAALLVVGLMAAVAVRRGPSGPGSGVAGPAVPQPADR